MSDAERMVVIDFIARNPLAGVSIGGGGRAAGIGSFIFTVAKMACRFS
jgi:hypothetical protein